MFGVSDFGLKMAQVVYGSESSGVGLWCMQVSGLRVRGFGAWVSM